jgi:hypothetical protein
MDPKTPHTITRAQIEHILVCLRYIDDVRKSLEAIPGQERAVGELRKSADAIYHIVKQLPETHELPGDVDEDDEE